MTEKWTQSLTTYNYNGKIEKNSDFAQILQNSKIGFQMS